MSTTRGVGVGGWGVVSIGVTRYQIVNTKIQGAFFFLIHIGHIHRIDSLEI